VKSTRPGTSKPPLPGANGGGHCQSDGDGLAVDTVAESVEEIRSQCRDCSDGLSDCDCCWTTVGCGGWAGQAFAIGSYAIFAPVRSWSAGGGG